MFWFRGSLVQIKYSILNEICHLINLFEDAFLFFKVDFKVSNIANFSFQIWNFQDKWLKEGYLLADKIRNFSSISNKLSLDTTTISLVLLLSDFSLLNIDLLCLGIRPRWLRFMSTNFWTKKKLRLNFNFCFKCSVITWDSTNMLKRISSSPVFFYSPPTSFTNNVLCIDRSPYYPKTTLEFFFITFRLLEVTRLGLSPAHYATIFRLFRAFSQVTLRKNLENDNEHK